MDFAESGNLKALEIIKTEAKYISYLIINGGNSFDLNDFVVFGELEYKNIIIRDEILVILSKKILNRKIKPFQIYFAKTDNYSSFIPACNLVIQNL